MSKCISELTKNVLFYKMVKISHKSTLNSKSVLPIACLQYYHYFCYNQFCSSGNFPEFLQVS